VRADLNFKAGRGRGRRVFKSRFVTKGKKAKWGERGNEFETILARDLSGTTTWSEITRRRVKLDKHDAVRKIISIQVQEGGKEK